jgi:hypothetical protein
LATFTEERTLSRLPFSTSPLTFLNAEAKLACLARALFAFDVLGIAD